MTDIGFDHVKAAQVRLKNVVFSTPFLVSPWLSDQTRSTVMLKLESLQKTGSFKIRGAFNAIALLDDIAKSKGVVTSSAGNHGQGVGLAADEFGISAKIYVPETTPQNKIRAIERYSSELVVGGQFYDEAHAAALADASVSGRTYISAFEDPHIIAGHGTVGLEMIMAEPGLDGILVPVGGGGLIAGCAIAVKAINPDIRVIGCQSMASCAMARSLTEKRVYKTFDSLETIAEGLEGGIGDLTFDLGQRYIDEMILVEEAEIRAAIRFLLAEHRLVVEGSGAVGVAALLSGRLPTTVGKLGIVISGGNLDYELLKEIVLEKD